MTQMSEFADTVRAKPIWPPPGDHVGSASSTPTPLNERFRAVPPPADETTQMSELSWNTIIVPSGDQAGEVGVVPSCTTSVEPPIVSTFTSPPWTNASFVPSADHAGSVAPATSGAELTVCALSVVTV